MMIKLILPKVKIRVSNLMSSTRITIQIQQRCIGTSKTCTYKNRLGIPQIFSENGNITKFNETLPDEMTNDYNDYSNVDDLQIRLKKLMESRPYFVNACNDYKKIDLSFSRDTIEAIEEITSITSKPNYRHIINTNENMPPKTGSLIEIHDPITASVTFGAVLRGAQTKFNENYNKLLVLTVNNEIKNVYAQDVSFHLFEVISPKWIDDLGIIDNRHDTKFSNRLLLRDILKSFICKSIKLLQKLQDPNNNQFSIAFSQHATPHRMQGITLSDLYESFKLLVPVLSNINASYYNQSIFLFSCHMGMISSPELWLVSSSYKANKLTNIIKENCSNAICSGSSYFVNSIENMDSLTRVFDEFENPIILKKYNEFLGLLYNEQTSENPKSFDDLNVLFNIWEGKYYKHFINVMKYFIIYPHTSIKELIEKLTIFEDQNISPNSVYRFLEELKIYNNRRNQLTDIYFSANIVGDTSLSQLAVSSIDELNQTSSQKELNNFMDSESFADKFPHLRKSKEYYQDHVVYGLPFDKSLEDLHKSSVLGLSLEKINSRKHLINIHIPDLVTKLSPNTNLFDDISSSSLNMKSLKNLINESALRILLPDLVEKLSFHDQNLQENTDWFFVGDALLSRGNKWKQKQSNTVTCLTISFAYNKYESNPFVDLEEKIAISFDSLSTLRIKNIGWNELEDCLNGVTELSPFTLFKERKSRIHDKNPATLDDDDIHNINFIFNVMKSHIKIRNLDGASTLDPSIAFKIDDSRALSKELSVVNQYEDQEKIITKVQFKPLEDQLKFSKSRFFINEIDKFAGKLTSRYCSVNQIPIYAHHKDIIESSNDELQSADSMKPENKALNDEAYISHNNLFLPNYHSNSFFQTLISRDASGYVSMAAYLIGSNYLTKPNIEVFSDENLRYLPLGINDGYVKMLDIFNSYEVLLNQFQILCYIQQFGQSTNIAFFKDKNYSTVVKQFSYLKRYGYKLDGPLSFRELSNQLGKIMNSYRLCAYLGTVHKLFWTLKCLEQSLLQKSFQNQESSEVLYDCIITSVGFEIPALSNRIARAYCFQLNIEIDVLISHDREINIGNQIECDKVMLLDTVNGTCILRESQLFH